MGVDDAGHPVGLNVTDELLRNLAGLRSDGNIQPLPALTVSKYALPSGEIAVVEVYPAELPPVRYKGRVWIRIGPRKGIASEQEERILTERRVAQAKTFDALPCLDSSLTDLSEERFLLGYRRKAVADEAIADNHRSLSLQLASLRFYDLRHDCPTHAGILLFADQPTRWLSGAYVQFVQFGGDTLADEVLNEKRIDGDLNALLQKLDVLIDLQIRQHPMFVTALQETMVYDYPLLAIRELLLNAVMHRSYQSTAPVRLYWFSDRIEVQSPGGLYGEASPENLPDQSAYRNPIVAEAMKILGFVNKFGSGVARAQQALVLNGNAPAEFRFDPHYVQALIRK